MRIRTAQDDAETLERYARRHTFMPNDLRDAALAGAAALRQSAGTWQPIETNKRHPYQSVIGCCYKDTNDYEIRTTHWDGAEGGWAKDCAYGHEFAASPTIWYPTHWMPLPAAPSPASEKE